MKLQQFKFKTDNGLLVAGEFEGNENSGKVILFSHGFGVTRNSRGMFTEIGNQLKDAYLIVRFDYNIVNHQENWTKVFSYSKQVEILRSVHKYINNKFQPKAISIIAHSIGCLVVGLAQLPNIHQIILLAGPPRNPYQTIKNHIAQPSATIINESGTSLLKRSDGSITYIEKDFWLEMKQVEPLALYKQLVQNSQVTFIRALSDQVIKEKDYSDIKNIHNLKYIEIIGDHDFSGHTRKSLLQLISSRLI